MRCASMRKMIFVESVESGTKMLVLGFFLKKQQKKSREDSAFIHKRDRRKNALCVGVHMDNIRSQHTLCKRMTDVCAGHIALVYRGHK